MLGVTDLFLGFVLVFDFVISLWNAYAAGVTLTLLRRQPGKAFAKASAGAALGLGFAGMAYATLLVLSFAALWLNFLALGDFLFLVSLDFLVFGALIIGLGLVITAQSVAIAYRQRTFGTMALAGWNVFAEVWDLSIYAEGFRNAAAAVGSSERERVNLYAVLAAALGISFIMTYVAYRHGVRRAERSIADSPGQPPADPIPYDARHAGRAHPLRTVVIVGIVTVVVVVGLIAVAPYVTPSTKVTVTEMDVWAPSNVCGLNANPVSYSGFSDTVGSRDAFQLQLPNFNASSCTVQTVSTNTSGFGLSDVQVPVTVAASQNGTLNLTVLLPTSGYSGPLSLIFS